MLIDLIKKQITIREVISSFVYSFVLIAFFLLILGSHSTAYAKHLHKVARVIDGDTVELINRQKVRLLSINTPELGYNGTRNQAGSLGAKKNLERLVLNKPVLLEQDVEQKDRYGRILGHLFLEDGQHINFEMIRSGHATLNIHPPNLRYAESLQLAQRLAEENRRGLWRLDAYQEETAADIAVRGLERWGRFSGQIQKITSFKKGTKLWLDKNVYIWISAANRRYFLSLDSYKGKSVEIRGWPRKRGLFWSINAIHPSQLLEKP